MSKSIPTARATLRIFLEATLQHKREIAMSLVLPVGALMINVAVPYFAAKALAASFGASSSDFNANVILLSIAVVIGILGNRFGFTRLMVLQARVMSDLNTRVFQHILERGVRFHTNNIGGKLVSDALDFVNAYSTLVNAMYITALPLFITLFGGIVVVMLQSWQLGVFLIGIVTVTLVWAYLESRTRFALRNRRLVASKKLTAHLSDSIVNAQTVKTFANEPTEIATNTRLNNTLLELRLTDWQRAGRSGSSRIGFLLVMLTVLILLIHSLNDSAHQTLDISLFAFTLTFTLILRLFDINAITRLTEESLLQASPMTTILQEDNEIMDTATATPIKVAHGEIIIRNVSFAYQEKHGVQSVFTDLNLHIQPGEKIGLVGPSGGGKSTLSRLLLRFDDVQAGTISIDNQDISTVTQRSLRQAIAYVPQEPLLFHRSIKENIRYGSPDASDEAIAHAAKLAYADEFIEKLADTYDTVVGERGVKLSGGQRQRVAIARAILKDAPVLLLDEATSALDSESEELIQKALWQLMKGRTAIVIAHRLSTIQKMDRIIVLEDGEISEQGSHQTLIEQSGTYAKLWARQSGGFLEP